MPESFDQYDPDDPQAAEMLAIVADEIRRQLRHLPYAEDAAQEIALKLARTPPPIKGGAAGIYKYVRKAVWRKRLDIIRRESSQRNITKPLHPDQEAEPEEEQSSEYLGRLLIVHRDEIAAEIRELTQQAPTVQEAALRGLEVLFGEITSGEVSTVTLSGKNRSPCTPYVVQGRALDLDLDPDDPDTRRQLAEGTGARAGRMLCIALATVIRRHEVPNI